MFAAEEEWAATPPTRAELVSGCPQPEASPTAVRRWFQRYLHYRGLNPDVPHIAFWTGDELNKFSIRQLESTIYWCSGMRGWEAEILARDIYTMLKESMPPRRTAFQAYVEYFFGVTFYQRLIFSDIGSAIDWSLTDWIVGLIAWGVFVICHIVLAYIWLFLVGYMFSTDMPGC